MVHTIVYTLYTFCTLYTLYALCTVHALYRLYTVCSVFTAYSDYKLYSGLLLTVSATLALRVLRERPHWQVFGMSNVDMTTPSNGAFFVLLAARKFLHPLLPNRPQEDGCFFFEV